MYYNDDNYYNDDYYNDGYYDNSYNETYYNSYNDNNYNYNTYDLYNCDTAPLSKRIIAFAIDFSLAILIQFISVYLFVAIKVPYLQSNKILKWLIVIHLLSFSIIFILLPLIFKGKTIGYMAMHLKCVKSSGFPPDILCYLTFFSFIYLFLINIIYILIKHDLRFLHNKITNTYVIDF